MRKIKLFVLLILIFSPTVSFSQESILQSNPISHEASSLGSASGNVFTKPVEEPKLNKPEEPQIDLPVFLKDTTLKVNFRSMYINQLDGRVNYDINDTLSYAAGGSLALRTGKIAEAFDLGLELFTSQKLYGPEDKDGALLLAPEQDPYTVLGVVNPTFYSKGHMLSFYRQRQDFPYVNGQDSRMTPNTFEAYNYGYLGSGEENPIFKFGGGYFDGIKRRNKEQFESMSEAVGIEGKDKGMPWAGFRFNPRKNLDFTVVNYTLIDTLNILYFDADYSQRLNSSADFKLSLQYSNQTAIGAKLLNNASDSTDMIGTQLALGYRSVVFRTAVTMNSTSNDLISPFGAYPGYNAAVIDNFNRAGEVAWKIGLSYDFKAINIEGLSAYVDFIQGKGAEDITNKSDIPDRRELDINLDFHLERHFLKGFWIRFRGGFIDSEEEGSLNDFRVIFNYGLPML